MALQLTDDEKQLVVRALALMATSSRRAADNKRFPESARKSFQAEEASLTLLSAKVAKS